MSFHDIKKFVICFPEIPLLTNFMFILMILGYIYILRMLITVLHFWFGLTIYHWLKMKFRCLSKHELHLKEDFEVYIYEDYVKRIKDYMQTLTEVEDSPIKAEELSVLSLSRDDETCPICVDSYRR